jgi:hypothetical protein
VEARAGDIAIAKTATQRNGRRIAMEDGSRTLPAPAPFGTVIGGRVPPGHEEISTAMRYVDVEPDVGEADKREAIAMVLGRASHVEAVEGVAT